MSDLPSDRAIPPRTGRKLPWIVLGFVVVLFATPILVLGWLGFVPGVSTLLGASEPQDLGVQYTPADLKTYRSKSRIRFENRAVAPDHPTKPGKKRLFADPRPLDTRFTQEELSAALNNAAPAWLPLKEVQIRLGDRSIELSGLLNTQRLPDFLDMAARLGLREKDLTRIAEYADRLADDVPVYLKASGGVEQAQLDLQLQEVRLGRFDVPTEALGRIASTGIHKTIKSSDSFALETLVPEEGSLVFTGILPTTIYLKKE